MSGFLIDTNVLSEYNRPGGPDAGVKRWIETTDRQSQHESVTTLAEIQKGIELLADGKRRVQLGTVAEARPGSLEASASATRVPGGVHLPPRRLDPSPSNAEAGGFA